MHGARRSSHSAFYCHDQGDVRSQRLVGTDSGVRASWLCPPVFPLPGGGNHGKVSASCLSFSHPHGRSNSTCSLGPPNRSLDPVPGGHSSRCGRSHSLPTSPRECLLRCSEIRQKTSVGFTIKSQILPWAGETPLVNFTDLCPLFRSASAHWPPGCVPWTV